MSKEEIESSYKKALKSLEGEKRSAIKKAKGIKGKKGKEALALVEKDFTNKLKALEASHQENVAVLDVESMNISEVSTNIENPSTTIDDENKPAVVVDEEETAARERKIAKSKKKKDRQKEKEAEIQEQIEEENANAGPGLRKIELEQIQQVLTPLNLKVSEVDADGHCLYRAVAAQSGKDFMAIRKLVYSGRSCCISRPVFLSFAYAYFAFSRGFLTK
jgi:OTU domain-containing protein 6